MNKSNREVVMKWYDKSNYIPMNESVVCAAVQGHRDETDQSSRSGTS